MQVRSFYGALGAIVAAGVLGGAALTWAASGEDAIKARRAVMSDVGAGAKILGPMLKGETPYDAEKAMLVARVWHSAAMALPHYFPAGSETGGETTASPKIWENMADFAAKSMAFAADSAAAASAEGEEAQKAALGKAFGNCQGCHEAYRVKK